MLYTSRCAHAKQSVVIAIIIVPIIIFFSLFLFLNWDRHKHMEFKIHPQWKLAACCGYVYASWYLLPAVFSCTAAQLVMEAFLTRLGERGSKKKTLEKREEQFLLWHSLSQIEEWVRRCRLYFPCERRSGDVRWERTLPANHAVHICIILFIFEGWTLLILLSVWAVGGQNIF